MMVSDRYAALIVLSHRTVEVKVPEGSTHMNVNSQSRHFYILHITSTFIDWKIQLNQEIAEFFHRHAHITRSIYVPDPVSMTHDTSITPKSRTDTYS